MACTAAGPLQPASGCTQLNAAALDAETLSVLSACLSACVRACGHSGTITVDEMREGLRAKDSKIPEAELELIMANADVNGDGKVDYEEFLAATMHLGKLEREEHLYKAFQVRQGWWWRAGSGSVCCLQAEGLACGVAAPPDCRASPHPVHASRFTATGSAFR